MPTSNDSEGSWGETSAKPSATSDSGSWGEVKASSGESWGDSGSSKPSDDTGWGSGSGSGGGSWGDDDGNSSKKSGGDWGTSSSGGAGSSDRKSGGSGGKGCFKCGEDGHMSRECPSGGSKGGKGCFKCGEDGHMSRECPSGGSGGGGGKGCFKCGEDGHMSRDCPSESSQGGKGCHRCGQEGHMARDCSEQPVDEDGKPRPPLYKPPDLDADDASFYDTISTGENFNRYDSMPATVSGEDLLENPDRYETFEEAFTSETIIKGLEATGIKKPTPIQKYGMRIVMAGRDLMACAQTGSGKTLAFILPILQDLFSDKGTTIAYGQTPQEPKAVIVTPTRELAIQIYREAYKYSAKSIVKVQIVYGGTSTGHQRAKMSEGCHILVGTPGRLLDFLDRGVYNFSKLKYFVLDEADRMIDQGFVPDVRKMVSHPTMPPKEERQTLMFSATFPEEVQRVASEFLVKNYLFLTVGILGAANSDVEQTIMKVEKFDKRKKLIEILGETTNNDRTMIFVESKKTADFLAALLSKSEYKATSIHGDRHQFQREEALADLKSGKFPILVATSVASRGLDIKDVRHVINYDLPKEIDDYVHRIGRTGRVGNKGKATSFYDPGTDKELAKHIVKIIENASQPVPEWLKAEVTGNSYDTGIDFGGLDIRDQASGGSQERSARKSEPAEDVEW